MTGMDDALDVRGIPYIEAHNLGLRYFGRQLFDNVSLQARKGELTAIVGPHGSGKTPLLLTLAGRMKPTTGTLRVGDFQLPRQRRKVLRRVGLSLFEGANDLQANLSVRYAAKMELELFGLSARSRAVESFLDEWGLSELAGVRVKDLSPYQMSWLGVAFSFVGKPSAVMVDDVEARLTLMESKDLMARLSQCARELNAAIVMGTTEAILAKAADECIYLPAQEGGE